MDIKIVNKSDLPIPSYKTLGSAGVDLMANIKEPITLLPLERSLIPTGLFIEIPAGYEAQIRPRSGMSINHGITMINCIGTIDEDYRGEIKIPIVNISNSAYTINHGDRIAQMIFAKYEKAEFTEVEFLEQTHRGEGGFGSTGRS